MAEGYEETLMEDQRLLLQFQRELSLKQLENTLDEVGRSLSAEIHYETTLVKRVGVQRFTPDHRPFARRVYTANVQGTMYLANPLDLMPFHAVCKEQPDKPFIRYTGLQFDIGIPGYELEEIPRAKERIAALTTVKQTFWKYLRATEVNFI